MCDIILTALVGVSTGAAGYLLSTFFFQPILQYRDLKWQLLSDLIFFANVVRTDHLNDHMKERGHARVDAHRRHAADLAAVYERLPWVYRKFLERRREKPSEAAAEMIGLSNTDDYDAAYGREKRIRALLRLPKDD